MLEERLLNLTQRLAKVGGWSVVDNDGLQSFWTPVTYEIYEFEGDTLPGVEEVLQTNLPAYREQARKAWEDCLQGKSCDNEMEIRTFKGNLKWIRVITETELDEHGNMQRISGAIMDITEQKIQEHTQRVLSERLFTTFECMTDAFYMLDTDWNLIYINKAAEHLIGRGVRGNIGASLWEIFPTLINTPLYAGFQNAMESNEPFQIEYFSDFMNNWIELSAYPSPEGLAVFFHSITEKKAMADRIAESEQRLKYVTRATLDAAWDWDLEKNEVWWSGGLERLFGWDETDQRQEMLTDNAYWVEQIHPDDRMRIINNLENLIKSDSLHWEDSYRLCRESGEYAYVEHQAYIIRRHDGLAMHVVGGITDVSNRVELENRMMQSQRLESIGKLTGHVAHDFNNLLTVILGNSELMKMSVEGDARLEEMAQSICTAAIRGSELTNRLLAFARRQKLEPRSIDVNELVASMSPLLVRTLGIDIDVQVFQVDKLPAALADANQLEGALLNLCINARDAMPNGGKLLIETRFAEIDSGFSGLQQELKPGSYIVVSVSDTGSGIPPELLKHVFEPFFTTKEAGKGTGLGLSSVFGFARQSNGNVSIYSEEGVGTTVRIYLPVSSAGAEKLPEKNLKLEGGSETILIVDDDEMVRNVASSLLANSLGYQVHVKPDARSALEFLESGICIDLVFTDVMMPGMNGKEFARQVRGKWPAMKILFTSGFTENSIVQDGMLDNGFQLLPKPYPLNELARRVRDLLEDV